jgi:MoaA/NifB/PqqE/SkfB family radical SAM enzyme
LKLIDQDVTYDQLIDVLASQPEMNKSGAEEKLKEKFDLLEFNPDRVRGAEDAHPAHADTPHLAVLEINKNCNLTCDFCFANAGPGRQDAVSVEELSHILDELEAIGIAMVWISGGEPLAHPEIDAVLEELSRRKLYVAMATNGTLLAEERYSELVANYVDEIQVSMDGATPETHNSMRGDGTFEQVLRGIRSLKNIDDSTLVSIGMTISERNRSEVAESIKLADQLNVNSWVWGALLPKGRGETLDGQIIGPEGVVDVYETMEAVEDEVDIRILKAMAGLTPMDPAPDEPTARCNAVTWEILIDDDGNVKPCILLREDEFHLGNLFETDLESILATEEAQYFTQSVDEMEEQDDGMPYSLVSAECRSF